MEQAELRDSYRAQNDQGLINGGLSGGGGYARRREQNRGGGSG
jgi:hypothetical protein